MAEPFKNLLNPALVQAMAQHLHRVAPAFDAAGFQAQALPGLETLEMKARSLQIAAALEATLPADFDQAAGWLETALAPPWAGDRLGSDHPLLHGLEGWALWPVGEFVARRGRAQPERALATLHALTQRFTAEFAIRPYIAEHPALAFSTLQRWVADPSAHVRRLVSEGSRPRLPWGLQLKALVADPAPTAPLLLALQDDPSEYVRRSVANHLNDIAKDHPQRVADWLDQHLPGAPEPRRRLLRHASRSLLKQGHPRVLAAWGLGQAFQGELALTLQPSALRVGDVLQLRVALHSHGQVSQTLAIDYAVHHVKANGSLSPKVFKGWHLQLAPGERRVLEKAHSMKAVTTRRYHAGEHAVELLVNGQPLAQQPFVLALG
jgi:3-methyladenine DNA glycosylase AlkC